MSEPSPDDVGVEIAVAAPIAAVWRALVDDHHRHAWWPYLDLEARRGGRFVERWRDADGRAVTTSGEVLEIEAPHRLRCTWRDEDWPAATEVELVLSADGEATRVRVGHAGWQRLGELGGRLRPQHADGWRMHLASLKRYVEMDAQAKDEATPARLRA